MEFDVESRLSREGSNCVHVICDGDKNNYCKLCKLRYLCYTGVVNWAEVPLREDYLTWREYLSRRAFGNPTYSNLFKILGWYNQSTCKLGTGYFKRKRTLREVLELSKQTQKSLKILTEKIEDVYIRR